MRDMAKRLFLQALLMLALLSSSNNLVVAVAEPSSEPERSFDSSHQSDDSSACNTLQIRQEHASLCRMLDWVTRDQDEFLTAHHDWAKLQGLLIDMRESSLLSLEAKTANTVERHLLETKNLRGGIPTSVVQEAQYPVVLAHGMGDSCFNSGLQHAVQWVSSLLGGVYVTCIPIGTSQADDTKNGYFLNMDKSVDVFAQAIQNDPKLQDGFHAIGFSQGNNVIRGYIAKYNAPAVHTFLSINGVNAGIGAVPYCRPGRQLTSDSESLSSSTLKFHNAICEMLMEQASRSAYTEFAQEHSFQANYWRDPRPSAFPLYQKYGQLAVWNNEAGFINETLKENWSHTTKFVWVLAEDDGMVWPKEGEQWGAPDSSSEDPFNNILPMKETPWYKEDLFGLRTADEAGKNYFESFPGDHLHFTHQDFERWVLTHLKQD